MHALSGMLYPLAAPVELVLSVLDATTSTIIERIESMAVAASCLFIVWMSCIDDPQIFLQRQYPIPNPGWLPL